MIGLVGVSHRTAPIEVRERLVIGGEELAPFFRELADRAAVEEAMVVSTCNRTEVVFATTVNGSMEDTLGRVGKLFEARHGGVRGHLYALEGEAALRHLFRVAASLDSLVVGEAQILGQLKDAFAAARAHGMVGAELMRAVSHAFRVAKQVRSTTDIGQGQVSVPSVAVDLALQIFGDLDGRRALLVGAGQMAETVAELLRDRGARFAIAGRSAERVAALCDRVGGEAVPWEELPRVLARVDVVVSSTSAPHPIIDAATVRQARRGHQDSLFLIDLAVPRDVEPAVGDLDGVFLYNVDDFQRIVAESRHGRQEAAQEAEALVGDELTHYLARREGEDQLKPTLLALRERTKEVIGAELSRSLSGRLKHLGDEDRRALEQMGEALVNKLLHAPTTKLRRLAEAGDPTAPDLLDLVRELFDLAVPRAAEVSLAPEVHATLEGPHEDRSCHPS